MVWQMIINPKSLTLLSNQRKTSKKHRCRCRDLAVHQSNHRRTSRFFSFGQKNFSFFKSKSYSFLRRIRSDRIITEMQIISLVLFLCLTLFPFPFLILRYRAKTISQIKGKRQVCQIASHSREIG